ncbi:glycosyltransferase [Vibrio metschnikovii]|nr:glycosyltransferase [Vibrio metschnikovii]
MHNSVAIIMSVYINDSVDILKESVISILGQDFDKIKLFIYRDGNVNSDIEDYLSKLSSEEDRVYYIRSEKNNGLAFALNQLIDIIVEKDEFKYIARMDSDDIAKKDRISKQVLFMEANLDCDVSGAFCSEFGSKFALQEKKLPTNHEELIRFSITRCPFIHPTVIFRSNIFSGGLRYPEDTPLTEDMAFWFLLLDNGYKFSNIPEVLLDYRINDKTLARRRGVRKSIDETRMRLRYAIRLKMLTPISFLIIFFRLFFHLMPTPLMMFLYNKLRG